MRKIYKALSVLLTVIMLLCVYTLPASAAASKLKLIKKPLNMELNNYLSFEGMGQNLYTGVYYKESDNSSEKQYYRFLYKISREHIEEWRKSGAFFYNEMSFSSFGVGGDWSYYWDADFAYSNSCNCFETLTGKDFIVKYDENKNTLTRVYDTDNSVGVSKNGAIFEFEPDNKKNSLIVKILDSNGKLTKKLSFKYECYISWLTPRCGYKYALVSVTKEIENGALETQLIRIDSKGNKKVLYSHKSTDKDFRGDYFYLHQSGENYASFYSSPGSKVSPNLVYLLDKNKIYKFSNIIYNENAKDKCSNLVDLGDRIYGTKAVARYTNSDNSGHRYALVDVAKDKYISKTYKYMETWDGKTFLVQLESGKYGYINSSGKLLATFDNAAPFNGDYAPVIKNGKAYLIDREMKRVSETIKVSKDAIVHSCDDDLYYIKQNEKITLFTYK